MRPHPTIPMAAAALFAALAVSCSDSDAVSRGLALNEYKLSFAAEGGSQTVGVTASPAGAVRATASDGWIAAVPADGGVNITVAPTDAVRRGEVYITAEGAGTGTVEIVQSAPLPVHGNISVTPAGCEFPAAGGDMEFTVETDLEEWSAEVSGEGFSLKGAPEGGRVVVTAALNEGEARSGKLTVGCKGVTAEAALVQQPYESMYRIAENAEGFYFGDSGQGSTCIQIQAELPDTDDNTAFLVLRVSSSLKNYDGFELDEGDYTATGTGIAGTVYPFVLSVLEQPVYDIRDGELHVKRDGPAYDLTMEFTATHVDTHRDTLLCYRYAGGISWTNACGPYGPPYSDRIPAGSVEYDDIKPGFYAASGTPSYSAPPGPGTWESEVVEYTYGGGDWWIQGWGVPVENCGLIIMDYYPEKKNIAVHNYGIYGTGPLPDGRVVDFRAEVLYRQGDEYGRVEVAAPRWSSDTLDFSVIRGPGGEETLVGVALYDFQTGEFVGFCTDLYQDAKLVFTRGIIYTAPDAPGRPVGRFNGVTGLYDLPPGTKLKYPNLGKKPIAVSDRPAWAKAAR